MKIDRLLSITLMLINRNMITAKELSEKYELSIRTIYRDIEAISAAGIPVVAYQGKKGGFCLMENYRIDRQLLTLDDMTSILLSLKGMNTAFRSQDVDETIEKIESIIPHDKKETVQQSFDNIIIDLSPWGGSETERNKINLLNEAIAQNRLISFQYRNLRGEDLVRIIEPMTMILKMPYWYIYGFCRERNDYRIFRVSRVTDCRILEKTFTRRSDVYREDDFFDQAKQLTVPITMRFSPAVRSKVNELYSDKIVEICDNGSIIVKVEYPVDEWVYSTILGYGSDVEVLSPPELRSIIKEKIKKTCFLYET